jgi:transcriptional regulator with XRE-family HTH domain
MSKESFNKKKFGKKIKKLRLESDYTMEQVGNYIGATKVAILYYERGINEPCVHHAYLLAQLFFMDLYDLLDDCIRG